MGKPDDIARVVLFLVRGIRLLRRHAASGHDALRIAPEVRPDVILLDLRLPDMLAPELIRELRVSVPGAKVVLFTAYPDHPAVGAALEAGAYGVFPKDASRMDLVAASIMMEPLRLKLELASNLGWAAGFPILLVAIPLAPWAGAAALRIAVE